MKAMIFAAGVGSRLKPWTDSHPKALVEVGGVPMLGRVINRLKDAGVTRIVVNVHHFAGQIEEYIEANDRFGCDILISDERDRLLDTGGGLRKAARWLEGGEPVILHNADILTDMELLPMLAEHRRTGADATLLVAERKSSRALLFNDESRMRGWRNMTDGRTLPEGLPGADLLVPKAFGGVHIIGPAVLEEIMKRPCGEPFSITPFYVETASTLDIRGYEPDRPYYWFDVGRMETLAEARGLLEK